MCLQTVVTLLCRFEKTYEGNYENKSQISTDSGNLEQWHFQIFFRFIFFCGRITMGIDSICIIFEYTAHVPASKLVIFSLD